jgi:carbamoyltransferase
MTAILGISAFYHDAAAALVVDGKIAAAAEEERFSRKKHDSDFPIQAIEWCLEKAEIRPESLDYVAFYDKPFLKFDRLLESHLAYAPRSFESFARAMPIWLKQKLWIPREMRAALKGAYQKNFIFTEHHEAHAAAAFFPSPFEDAAILTMDGVGEWATASFGVGRGNQIQLEQAMRFPHSPGLLYTAFTTYAGFQANSDEYKLMGLAPYGEPVFYERILDQLIDLKEDGSFWMDMSYFEFAASLRMTNSKFEDLFGAPTREANGPIEQHTMDVAASIQKVIEEIVLRSAKHVHARTGMKNLCLSGGVALNCVANGRVMREGPFDEIWVQPAAGDSGSALGAALFVWHQLLKEPRTPVAPDAQQASLLGPEFATEDIAALLEEEHVRFTRIDDEKELADAVSTRLETGNVVGWFQGRMEFGPRALGNRSILADPRQPDMQGTINRKVKFREGFRPFAPAVLKEFIDEFFDWPTSQDSPYMLIVTSVSENQLLPLDEEEKEARGINKLQVARSKISAVTHVDGSARIQTIDAERHGRFRKLLETFHQRTGCAVLVNTSFNLGWEPIVCTPREAYNAFMSCELDTLCMGPFLIDKSSQPSFVKATSEPRPLPAIVDLMQSPCCTADLKRENEALRCSVCDRSFSVSGGIPQLFWPHDKISEESDVTETVKAFYEETPFPNYQDHESVRSLIDRSRLGSYAEKLGRSIPFNSTVLEVGCGTGQLSNFLGISSRTVIGTDLCLNSLSLGEEFRSAQGLERVTFAQMNLFRPTFKPESFDVVLCNGVLHHTSDPRGGFQALVPLVRPGGFIVIGLYHRWGRLMTDTRRQLFRLTGGRAHWIDPYLRGSRLSKDKERAWFSDQYQHPHESKHTVGEVMNWFEEAGIQTLRGIPALTLDSAPPEPAGLFQPEPAGSRISRFLAQAGQVVTGNREGGFFLVIGKREG